MEGTKAGKPVFVPIFTTDIEGVQTIWVEMSEVTEKFRERIDYLERIERAFKFLSQSRAISTEHMFWQGTCLGDYPSLLAKVEEARALHAIGTRAALKAIGFIPEEE